MNGQAISVQFLTDTGWKNIGEVSEVKIEPGTRAAELPPPRPIEVTVTINEWTEGIQVRNGKWIQAKPRFG